MRIAILTSFNREYAPLADVALPLMKRYADKHGYGLHVGKYHTDPANLGDYGDRGKIALYNQHYDAHDILVWMDIDMLIMNSDITVEEKIGSMPFLWCYDVNGPNSAFWIARCQPSVKLFLNAVACNAPNRGKIIPREDIGPPHRVVVQLEPHGSSDQEEMTRLMNIPPYSSVACYCQTGRKVGVTYLYDEYGWQDYYQYGNYQEGDWILTFPSIPFERRLELMQNYAKKAI